MSENLQVIGVDLGGTKVEACLLDAQRRCLARERAFCEAAKGLDHVIETVHSVVERAADGQPYAAVGIGAPGTYVPADDAFYGVPHTPAYETPGFFSRLKADWRVPVAVENDANCLALAEYFAACVGRYHYVMAVIIGTGMGYGLILGDRLYRGARGGAGEIGHTTIKYDGRLCECGRRGCAEAYLSGSSISRRYEEATGSRAGVPEIYQRCLNGEPAAVEIIEETSRLMAEIFANAVNAFDLEAVILGGGVSNLPVWYEKVPTYLQSRLFGVPRGEVPILKAQLGDSAGVFGAAYLALRELALMDF